MECLCGCSSAALLCNCSAEKPSQAKPSLGRRQRWLVGVSRSISRQIRVEKKERKKERKEGKRKASQKVSFFE